MLHACTDGIALLTGAVLYGRSLHDILPSSWPLPCTEVAQHNTQTLTLSASTPRLALLHLPTPLHSHPLSIPCFSLAFAFMQRHTDATHKDVQAQPHASSWTEEMEGTINALQIR